MSNKRLDGSNLLKIFIAGRLDEMAARPQMWAGTKEAFVLQLILLAEVSWIGTPERFAIHQQAMTRTLWGPELGCAIPVDALTEEWARNCVVIARKFVAP